MKDFPPNMSGQDKFKSTRSHGRQILTLNSQFEISISTINLLSAMIDRRRSREHYTLYCNLIKLIIHQRRPTRLLTFSSNLSVDLILHYIIYVIIAELPCFLNHRNSTVMYRHVCRCQCVFVTHNIYK